MFLTLAVGVIGVIVLLLRTRYGLALQAIRDNEIAAKSNGIDVNRARMVVFVVAAAATAMVGAMIFLQKLSITPFSAFSINDWTVNMIFITVIGGIGRVEGPILGTVIFFVLREFLADLASTYLIILGVGRHRRHAQGAERNLGLCRRPLRLAAFSAGAKAGAKPAAENR